MIRKIFYKWSRIFIHIYAYYIYKCSVTQWCSTLCNPMDRNPPGSSVHGILQARVLEWDVVPFSRGSSQPRDQTQVFCFAGRFFTIWAMMLSSGWNKMAHQCHSHIPINRKRANGKIIPRPFKGITWKLHPPLQIMFCWPDLTYVPIPCCKGGWPVQALFHVTRIMVLRTSK